MAETICHAHVQGTSWSLPLHALQAFLNLLRFHFLLD